MTTTSSDHQYVHARPDQRHAASNIGGLASGLDTNSIINALLAIDRDPETQIQHQQTVAAARSRPLSQIKTQMREPAERVVGAARRHALGRHAVRW